MARMGIFRILPLILAVVVISSLISNGAEVAAVGLGALLLVPFILFKVFLVFMVFGFMGRAFSRRGHHRRPWDGQGWDPQTTDDTRPTEEDKFEDWHRMAHAREEVDRWAPEV